MQNSVQGAENLWKCILNGNKQIKKISIENKHNYIFNYTSAGWTVFNVEICKFKKEMESYYYNFVGYNNYGKSIDSSL